MTQEVNIKEIEYQSILATFDWVAKHYNQIQNLTYKGDTLPLELFNATLSNNYKNYLTNEINEKGYDIPSDYLSVFFFDGLYGTSLYYAEQLKNNKNKTKVKEDINKVSRLLAKAVISLRKQKKNP